MPPRPPARWAQSSSTHILAPSTAPSSRSCTLLLSSPPCPSTTTAAARALPSTHRTIKSTAKHPKPSRFNHNPHVAALTATTTSSLVRRAVSTPLRTGLLAQKRGMTALFDAATGVRTPCTVLQLDRNEVVAHKTRDVHGYWAVQVGAGEKQIRSVTKPMLGHFAQAGVGVKRWVGEFRVRGKEGLGVRVGEAIGAGWFSVGQWVDVKGKGRGKGFAGGMKRHGFGGQPASHGQSLMHRGMGSAGGSQGSGSRVLPGKRMAGRMGGESVTVKNLKVLQVDEANGLVVVNGAVPGPKNQLIRLQDAMGKPWPEGPMTTQDIPALAANAAAVAAVTAAGADASTAGAQATV